MCYTDSMILINMILVLSLLFLLPLTGLSFYLHGQPDYTTYKEAVSLTQHSPLLLAGSLVSFFVLFFFLHLLLMKMHRYRLRLFMKLNTLLCALWTGGLSFLWIRTNRYPPIADQLTVWDSARLIASQQSIEPFADYISSYTQQKGIILFMAGLIRLFGSQPISSFRPWNILCAMGIVILLCAIAWEIYRKEEVVIFTGVLTAFFFPLILYTVYIYGTISAYGFSLLGLYATLRTLRLAKLLSFSQAPSWKKLWRLSRPKLLRLLLWSLLLAGSFAVCTQLYTGSLIAVTASTLTLSVQAFLYFFFRKKRKEAFLLSLCTFLLLFSVVFAGDCADLLFRRVSGLRTGDGVPASAYVYMGITSENGACGPGSHNGTDITSFHEHGMDTAATDIYAKEESVKALKEYASGKRPLSFFLKKTEYQWCDGWFGSATLTVNPLLNAPVSSFFRFLMQKGLPLLGTFLSLFLPFIYLFALTGVCFRVRQRFFAHMGAGLPELFFIGGFVFQFFWESKSRYCLPYVMILLPVAAYGLHRSCCSVRRLHYAHRRSF